MIPFLFYFTRFFLLISLKVLLGEGLSLRSRPVVGILSQPFGDTDYIAASYVKWLESAGARSIVVPYDADEELLIEIFSQINGFLFPGGDSELPPNAKTIWKMALERNQNEDDFFPVWGTCLGFEFIVMLTGGESALQGGFDSENISLPLIFPTEEDVIQSNGVYSTESHLYPMPSVLRDNLSQYNITMNNHHEGITPTQFLKNFNLTDFFHITSTNYDRKGRQFVSTIESKKYPIYGIQYHPEKNNFEFGLMDALQPLAKYYSDEPFEVINHSEKAVDLSIKLALFFVGKVRQSTSGTYNMTHRHPTVYQYPVVTGRGFEQVYLIPKASSWEKKPTNSSYENSVHNRAVQLVGVVAFLSIVVMIFPRSFDFGKYVDKSYVDIPDDASLELLTEHESSINDQVMHVDYRN